jgi:phosphopentomutase
MSSPRTILMLLDGLGVGAMKDVAQTRPQDAGSDSLAHALAEHPADLPNLSELGLGHAAPSSGLPADQPPSASWGRSELGYPGADSYLGHQVLLGGDVSNVALEHFAKDIDRYAEQLRSAGHRVTRHADLPVLVVDEAMVVAESLEADPGMNYNVTGSLDLADFDEIVGVARQVREAAPVVRVIAVGGRQIDMEDILGSLRRRDGAVGVDTPALGVYGQGVELLHLGNDFGFASQAQVLIADHGLSVSLVGKMADIVWCPDAERLPGVDTDDVLALFEDVVDRQRDGLIAVNVQELDLAGHRENCAEYVRVLEMADQSIGRIATKLEQEDLLIVTGDHGDDPSRGRLHTREEVPVLAHSPSGSSRPLGTRSTLADVGASLTEWLGVPPTGSGRSFVDLVR